MASKKCEMVEKRNILNEIRDSNMSLQELRLFSIYLARINARDVSTRKVRFKLEDFQRIIDLGRLNIEYLVEIATRLVRIPVTIPDEQDPTCFTTITLFKKFKLGKDKDNHNQYYVEMEAHEEALPLMFNFKERYFTYDLGNILRLTSRNQFRLYELLKQYEHIGTRDISLEQLKDWLGIAADKYERWVDFKKYVIDECQKALKKHTDIVFEYEKIKAGRKVVGVRFAIAKNKDYKNPLGLEEFLENKPMPDKTRAKATKKTEEKFAIANNNSFTIDDLKRKANA